jgi:hypothetical protein
MLTLSDLAIQPIEADEAAAITVELAAILPDDLPEPRRPALNQIRLTDTGAIELDGCNEPIAPGQEAQWLAEVLLALLGLDELDDNGHAAIPGGLLVLIARAMGRTSLPPLGQGVFLEGLARFGTSDADVLKAIHDRYSGPRFFEADSSSAPLRWPPSAEQGHDVAFAHDEPNISAFSEPALFSNFSTVSPESNVAHDASPSNDLNVPDDGNVSNVFNAPTRSRLLAIAAAMVLVIAAIVFLPQLMARGSNAAAVETPPAAGGDTAGREAPAALAPPREDAAPPAVVPSPPPAASTELPRTTDPAPVRAETAPAPAPAPAAVAPPAAPTLATIPASEQLARSPDGSRLAILRTEAADNSVANIWIADTGTGSVTRLTNHSLGRPAGASWFPDGSRIAYGVGDTLVIAGIRGDESRRVKSPVPGRPVQVTSVSGDGSRIVVYVSGDGAWTYDLHSGQFTRVSGASSEE